MQQRAIAGYTLIELLMVVAILSIVAVIALPVTQRVTQADADIAVDDMAQVLRFARDEARRKREPRLVSCNLAAGQLTVRAVDSEKDTSTPGKGAAYLVAPGTVAPGSAMALVSCSFTFADNATAATVVFNAAGNPVRGIGKGPARDKALRSGAIVLGAGPLRRSVNLNVTGRITLS